MLRMTIVALPIPTVSPNEPTTRERLSALLSNAPVILFATDATGILSVCEGRVLQELRIPATRLIGRPVRELCKDYPWMLQLIDEALSGRESSSTGNAAGTWYQVRCAPLRDSQGAIEGIIGVATDVTMRKTAEQGQAFLREASIALNRSLSQDELL